MIDGITIGPFNLVKPNRTVTLRCSSGYLMKPGSSIDSHCTDTGTWDPPIGECIDIMTNIDEIIDSITPSPENNNVKMAAASQTTLDEKGDNVGGDLETSEAELGELLSAISIVRPTNPYEDVSDFFKRDYYVMWNKRHSRIIFTAPSDIYAIIDIPNPLLPSESPSIVIICFHGEIIVNL